MHDQALNDRPTLVHRLKSQLGLIGLLFFLLGVLKLGLSNGEVEEGFIYGFLPGSGSENPPDFLYSAAWLINACWPWVIGLVCGFIGIRNRSLLHQGLSCLAFMLCLFALVWAVFMCPSEIVVECALPIP